MATLHPARAYTIAQELPITPDPAMAVFEIVIHTSLLTLGTRTVTQPDFLGEAGSDLGRIAPRKLVPVLVACLEHRRRQGRAHVQSVLADIAKAVPGSAWNQNRLVRRDDHAFVAQPNLSLSRDDLENFLHRVYVHRGPKAHVTPLLKDAQLMGGGERRGTHLCPHAVAPGFQLRSVVIFDLHRMFSFVSDWQKAAREPQAGPLDAAGGISDCRKRQDPQRPRAARFTLTPAVPGLREEVDGIKAAAPCPKTLRAAQIRAIQ